MGRDLLDRPSGGHYRGCEHMNETALDILSLEDLDFEIECESNYHGEFGTSEVICLVQFKLPCCDFEYEKYNCFGCLDATKNSYATALHVISASNEKPCMSNFNPLKSSIRNVVYLT